MKDTTGPAFPSPYPNSGRGISTRDLFALVALHGMLSANATAMPEVNDVNVDFVLAREAYRSADAMLEEREKQNEQ